MTTGTEGEELETELAEYLGAPHVLAVSSCTAALEIALALDLPPGPESVCRLGRSSPARWRRSQRLQPVLLDVEPDTLNLSPTALEPPWPRASTRWSPCTSAGCRCPRTVHALCGAGRPGGRGRGSRAVGARDDSEGRSAAPAARAACFSFYATKNLTSREGGALATDDADLADFAAVVPDPRDERRLLGALPARTAAATTTCVEPGIKANLPDLLAALARSQLRRFDAMQARRRELVHRLSRPRSSPTASVRARRAGAG